MKHFLQILLIVLCFIGLHPSAKAQFNNALSYNSAFANFTTMPDGIVSGISSDFTIETWVKWDGGNDFQRIFDFGNGTGSYMFLTPSENSSNHFVTFAFKLPGLPELRLSGGTLIPGTWTHLAVTVDYSTPATPVGNLYVGGVLVATDVMYDAGSSTPYRPSDLGNTTQNWLGQSQFSGSPFFDPFFSGTIDELRISNTVRYTGASFTPALTPFVVDGSTVALYHFDEGGTSQSTFDAVNAAISGFLGSSSSDNNQDPSWVLSTLPVKLIAFSGQETDKANRLTWRASTTSAGQFVVERSGDGKNFHEIGTVAFSKVPGTFDYHFDDPGFASEKNYYRLSIQEYPDKVQRSAIILLAKNLSYGAFPTAAQNEIFITVPKPTQVSIYNSGGVLVKRMQLSVSQNIYLSGWSNGLYFVKFEGTKQTLRFVKR